MRSLAVAFTALVLAACSNRSEPPAPVEEQGPAELRQAPTTSARLAGFTYRLDTYLWRDFMPGPEQSAQGSPLMASLRITVNDDTAAFPARVVADRMWVVNGDAVWQTVPREEQPRGSFKVETLEVMGRDGPRWGPGVNVDVIVRLRDRSSGETALVRAPAQPIHRTD